MLRDVSRTRSYVPVTECVGGSKGHVLYMHVQDIQDIPLWMMRLVSFTSALCVVHTYFPGFHGTHMHWCIKACENTWALCFIADTTSRPVGKDLVPKCIRIQVEAYINFTPDECIW